MDGTTPGGGYGRWVFHCHIFFHASFGMISEFTVVEPDGNERPYVNSDATRVEVDEGDVAVMTGTYADPDEDDVTLAASVGTVVDNGDGTWGWSFSTTDGPEESGCVFITATDANGIEDQAVFELVVNNLPPTIDITSPASGSVYLVGSEVEVTASVSDPGTADVLECEFDWDGGGPTDTDSPVAGVCSASNTFTAAGVYTVEVTVTDDDGASASETVVIVVYDPDAGHLTGAGDIDSPAGAYVADATIADKAHFDCQAKYHKEETTPRGKLKFDLKASGVDFKVDSTALEWLVIVGSKAQVQGTAKVNGTGSYGFLLTVRDGKAKDTKMPPGLFRLKVWDENAGDAVVYDNAPGPDDIDDSPLHGLRSGNIGVHKGK
jgi:PKD repeat protein